MADKVSVGSWIYDHLDLPESTPKLLRHWPIFMFLLGCAVTMLGIGIKVEFTGTVPFFKVESVAGSQTPNHVLIAIGLVIAAIGIGFDLKILPRVDKNIDRSWPVRKKSDMTARLALAGPLLVDDMLIGAMIERFDRKWPELPIDWPKSNHTIIKELRRVQGSPPKADFKVNEELRRVPDTLAEAERGKAAVAANLPALVQRCATLDDTMLVRIIRQYLIHANYRLMSPAFESLCVFASFGIPVEIPASWNSLRNRDLVAAALYGEERWKDLRRGVLVMAGGAAATSKWGPGVDLYGPKWAIQHHVDTPNAIGSLIPQLEVQVALEGVSVQSYSPPWIISRFGPPGTWMPVGFGSDTSEDAAAIAKAEALRKEWDAQKNEASPQSRSI